MSQPVYVVFNPRSGKGRGATLVAPVLAALSSGSGEAVAHGLTTKAGDEALLAREALARGYRTIVAVGGDGTWGNVGDAILKSGVRASLGLVAGGTGCDFAKSLGIPAADVAAAARVIRGGVTRTIDVGRVEDKHFLNVVGFGFDIAVIEHSWRVRWLGGHALYLYCSLRQLHSYAGFRVETVLDGAPAQQRDLMMLVIANARVFGGGFRIAPKADLADGQLDMMAFGNIGLARRLPLMVRLLRGTHEAAREVASARARSFRLRFEQPPTYETDGEWNQAKAAEIRVETLAAALDVLVPAGA